VDKLLGLLILDKGRVSIIIARMATGSKVVTLQDYREEQRERYNRTALAGLGTMIASPCLALPLIVKSSLILV
jgi:hypothetical protein